MEKKVLKIFMAIAFVTLGFISYNATADNTEIGDIADETVITCNAKPFPKAKCWTRSMCTWQCLWTGKASDWC